MAIFSKSTLKQKVCLVTGGARGIGLATARLLKQQGAKVAISDVDHLLGAKVAKEEGLLFVPCDVRNSQQWQQAVQHVTAHLGPIDCLINNAGIMPMGRFLDESPSMSQTQLDINLMGVIQGIRAVLPSMQERRYGHIVNVASLAGVMGVPGAAVYCASKYAVVGLTESLAHEYRGSGIGFSIVMPAKVHTELSSGTENASKLIPAVEPEDVAQAICKSILNKRLRTSVPAMVDPLNQVFSMLPQFVQSKGRAILGDQMILKGLNKNAHASYEQRISALNTSRQDI
ncbi:MAG: SDR family oxidoreductase [Limnobacter sp.]|nr:SDR family oxidoreductase [Limnobacter sp.]